MREVFHVLPYGDRWSVSSGGEPLIVTRSKSRAQRLAREAKKSLQPAASANNARPLEESRSFAPGGKTR